VTLSKPKPPPSMLPLCTYWCHRPRHRELLDTPPQLKDDQLGYEAGSSRGREGIGHSLYHVASVVTGWNERLNRDRTQDEAVLQVFSRINDRQGPAADLLPARRLV
jgi:hypothetical protein